MTRGDSSASISKITDGRTRLGRAYDNDVIISDPFVAAHQFELVKLEENYQLNITESANPVLRNHKLVEGEGCVLAPGDSIVVGKSRIDMLRADADVAPTKQQFMSSWRLSSRVSPAIAVGTLLTCCGIDAVMTYWQTSSTLQWREPAYLALFSVGTIFVWAAIWALVGRLLKHQSLFFVQLFLTTLVCGLFIFVFPLAEIVTFNTNSAAVGEYISYLAGFGFIVLLLKANLAVATNLQRTGLAAGFAGVFLVGAVFLTERYSDADFEYRQDYPATIKPPFAVVRNPVPIDEYLSDIDRMADGFGTK